MTKLDKEFEKQVNLFVSLIPPYGIYSYRKRDALYFTDLHEDGNARAYITNVFNKKEVENIILYLSQNGFVVIRYDLDKDGDATELTDRGRELKRKGTIEEFNRFDLIQTQQFYLQKELVHRSYMVNVALLCSTVPTGIYACCQMFDFYEEHYFEYSYLLIFVSGVIATIAVLLLGKMLKKMRLKRKSL